MSENGSFNGAMLYGLSPDFSKQIVPVMNEKGIKKPVNELERRTPVTEADYDFQAGLYRPFDVDTQSERDILVAFILEWAISDVPEILAQESVEFVVTPTSNLGKLNYDLNRKRESVGRDLGIIFEGQEAFIGNESGVVVVVSRNRVAA